jgi:hypothetical protein
MGDTYPQKENFMNNTGRTTPVFLTGFGIGAGLAALFAPRSGEETREWSSDTAEPKFKVLRRMGRFECYVDTGRSLQFYWLAHFPQLW